MLERVARGRPERSLVLTGLRGVGKTVLLNALRSSAVRRRWGTGKLEARPDQGLRRPLSSALHQAVRELGHPQADDVDHVLGVIKSFAQRDAGTGAKLRDRWNPGIDAPAVSGRADSGDIEIDLVELFTDVGGLAADVGKGVAVFIDEMQDLGPDDVSALCAACHEISQSGLPVIVVGAGLPHLPAVLSASKSYSERLFRYQRIDRLDRDAADRALSAPAAEEDAEFTDEALDAMYAATGGYPYFIQAYGKVVWDLAPRSPITAEDVAVAAPEAEAELAVGFFGSRYERATPGEREYLRAMADAAVALADARRGGPRRHPERPDLRRRRRARQEAAVALAGPRLTDEEGPHLLRRARPDRVHRAALRALPSRARLSTASERLTAWARTTRDRADRGATMRPDGRAALSAPTAGAAAVVGLVAGRPDRVDEWKDVPRAPGDLPRHCRDVAACTQNEQTAPRRGADRRRAQRRQRHPRPGVVTTERIRRHSPPQGRASAGDQLQADGSRRRRPDSDQYSYFGTERNRRCGSWPGCRGRRRGSPRTRAVRLRAGLQRLGDRRVPAPGVLSGESAVLVGLWRPRRSCSWSSTRPTASRSVRAWRSRAPSSASDHRRDRRTASSQATHLTGVGDKSGSFLQSFASDLDLQGLLTCAVMIAGLGVLNDVTITQRRPCGAAGLPRRWTGPSFSSGMRIGRDRIASTIYTIAFAYTGRPYLCWCSSSTTSGHRPADHGDHAGDRPHPARPASVSSSPSRQRHRRCTHAAP